MSKSLTGIDSGFFGWVKRFGNTFPSPFMLFTLLALIILVASYVLSELGIAVNANVVDKSTGKLVNKVVEVKNLFDLNYFHSFLKDFTKTYISFAPLGLVMVTMIGIGYVKETKFFDIAMRRVCQSVPRAFTTFTIIMMACIADMASNAGIVISTTLAAALFASIGRNPIVGAVVGYAVAHGAEPTNFLLTGFMVTMSSITQAAADSAGLPNGVTPLSNYYFLATSCILLSVVLTFVVEKILPRYVQMEWSEQPQKVIMDNLFTLGPKGQEVLQKEYETEARATKAQYERDSYALRMVLFAVLVYAGIILTGVIPDNGFLRNLDGTLIPKSPFINGVVAILVGLFFVVGTTFGYSSGTIKNQHDIPKHMCSGIKDAAMYFVVCFPAAYFIKFFGDSNLTTIISVNGAELLKTINFTGLPLAFAFILLVMFLNLFVTSGSAKWLIFAPIFVPMFYELNFSPEFTQMLYVIGDTITDPIAPINYYIPIVIMIMEKYKKSDEVIGMGNVISLTLPFSITIGIVLSLQLLVWYWLSLPLGPGAVIPQIMP